MVIICIIPSPYHTTFFVCDKPILVCNKNLEKHLHKWCHVFVYFDKLDLAGGGGIMEQFKNTWVNSMEYTSTWRLR